MNKVERRELKEIANRIMDTEQNKALQKNFACVYDDIAQICEPSVFITMSDFRTLCHLANVKDTLTIRDLPHLKSIKDYIPEAKEEEA